MARGHTKYRRIPESEGDRKGRVANKVFPPQKNPFKPIDFELPIFEGSLPSCSPHSMGYTRTSLHVYFPVAKRNSEIVIWYPFVLVSVGAPPNTVQRRCRHTS